jgi:hypothetical protein
MELQNFIIPEWEAKSQAENQRSFAKPCAHSCLLGEQPRNGNLSETAEWKSMRQLTVFRQNLKDIEDSVSKGNRVTPSKGRRKKRSIKDREIFRQGRTDARKIKVRTARIELGKAKTRMDLDLERTGIGIGVH